MVKPILFNTEMVRAILDGRKNVTRRVVKDYDKYERLFGIEIKFPMQVHKAFNSPCEPGDILWVRETWTSLVGSYLYRADQKPGMKNPGKWRPSIHMPREAARIFLRVTDVRVERLQEITMQDIRREGSVPSCAMCSFNEAKSAHGIKCRKAIERSADCALENRFPDCGFRGLWDSTIKPADRERYSWAANPFCWVIEFEKCEKPEEV